MSKSILETVARAISVDQGDGEECAEAYLEHAESAISALGIIVLPEGSEPEVGDTLFMDSGAELEAWVLEETVSTSYWEELKRQGCEITKRNNRPVLMDNTREEEEGGTRR